MKWTHTLPRIDGFYWFSDSHCIGVAAVDVAACIADVVFPDEGGGTVQWEGWETENESWRWAGPLEEPTDG